MIGSHLDPQKSLRSISAKALDELGRVTSDLSRRRLNPPYLQPSPFWAKLSGSSSPYSFREVYGQAAGGAMLWTVHPNGRTGISNATEVNAASGLNNKIAPLEETETPGQYRFEYPRHGSGGGGGTGLLPGCCVGATPTTLNLTSNDPTKNFGLYPNMAIVWGAPPCSGPPNPGYYSSAPLPSPGFGIVRYYYVTCTIGGNIRWQTVGGIPPGCAVTTNPHYDFGIGTCTPFFFSGGFSPTLDPTQIFTISG